MIEGILLSISYILGLYVGNRLVQTLKSPQKDSIIRPVSKGFKPLKKRIK